MTNVQTSDGFVKQAGQDGGIDTREALFNEGAVGPIGQVQVSTECIVQLRGILFDLDPRNYQACSLLPAVPLDPHEFYLTVARHWLSRHPVLARAEVRNSGTGLHALLWFYEPVIMSSDDDRKRWDGIVKAVQAALPIDPDQPAITALTRPIGSVNSKNRATVSVLHEGDRVSHDDVLSLFTEMSQAPFATVMKILMGDTKAEPCPVCGKEDSRLSGLSRIGRCYPGCGQVKLDQLYDTVFAPRSTKGKRKEATPDAASC